MFVVESYIIRYMIDGILLIDKQRDITSYDVIRKLKKVLPKKQKIGHAGTLDPFATGLLIILLGKATKRMSSILQLKKKYLVKAEFGYATDTQDSTGEKINISENIEKISKEKIVEEIGKNLLGEIEQTPPVYSAVKIKGKRAYELAREGKEVEIKPKQVNIHSFEIVKYDWPFVSFEIECSSGTYVRTLVDDLGKCLDTFATAVELRRSEIGEYDVKDALDSKDISEETVLKKILKLED